MPPYDYSALTGPEGADNDPGLEQGIWIAPLSAFDTLEVPTAAGLVAGDSLIIPTAHTFNIDEGFVPMYTTKDTGKLMSEPIGERDGRGHMPKLEFFHPGSDAAAAEFAYAAKNDNFIILVRTANGKVLQLGREGMGADIVGTYDTGTLSSGRNGWTFACEVFGKIFEYAAAIEEKP